MGNKKSVYVVLRSLFGTHGGSLSAFPDTCVAEYTLQRTARLKGTL